MAFPFACSIAVLWSEALFGEGAVAENFCPGIIWQNSGGWAAGYFYVSNIFAPIRNFVQQFLNKNWAEAWISLFLYQPCVTMLQCYNVTILQCYIGTMNNFVVWLRNDIWIVCECSSTYNVIQWLLNVQNTPLQTWWGQKRCKTFAGCKQQCPSRQFWLENNKP